MYFKGSPTVDPRSLQGPQPLHPAPSGASQPSHPGMQISPQQERQLTRLALVALPKSEKPSKTKTSNDPHAPRAPKSQAKRDTAKAEGRPYESDSGSDDELAIQDEEPAEMTPALLTVAPPTDERGRALYSAVQAVWSPRNRPAAPEKIRNGIAGFGETVRSLRDAWKAKNESLRKAELPDSPTATDAASLKEEVARYRQAMESVAARSLLFGHPAIVKRYVFPCFSPDTGEHRPRPSAHHRVAQNGLSHLIVSMIVVQIVHVARHLPRLLLQLGQRRLRCMHNVPLHRFASIDSVPITLLRDLPHMLEPRCAWCSGSL
jgi:hypothetical protein